MPGERTWFADERHAEVLRLLAAEHRVESGWLAGYFGVSAESIRKDLTQLEARGLLRRVHGGAVPGQRLREESNVTMRTEHAEQKLAIALKVSSRVCVMGHGRIVFEGTPQQLAANERLLSEWLAV